jgi:hypothetical protein
MAKNLKFPVDFLASRRLDMILAKIQLNPQVMPVCAYKVYQGWFSDICAKRHLREQHLCERHLCKVLPVMSQTSFWLTELGGKALS